MKQKLTRRFNYLAGDTEVIKSEYAPKLAHLNLSPEALDKKLEHFAYGEFIAHLGTITTYLVAAEELAKLDGVGEELSKDVIIMGEQLIEWKEGLNPEQQKLVETSFTSIHQTLGWNVPPQTVIGNRTFLNNLKEKLQNLELEAEFVI